MEVPADERTKFSAMELTTAWGVTLVAQMLVNSGKLGNEAKREGWDLKGFVTPEQLSFSGQIWELVCDRICLLTDGKY
jgi:hypothetical protein